MSRPLLGKRLQLVALEAKTPDDEVDSSVLVLSVGLLFEADV